MGTALALRWGHVACPRPDNDPGGRIMACRFRQQRASPVPLRGDLRRVGPGVPERHLAGFQPEPPTDFGPVGVPELVGMPRRDDWQLDTVMVGGGIPLPAFVGPLHSFPDRVAVAGRGIAGGGRPLAHRRPLDGRAPNRREVSWTAWANERSIEYRGPDMNPRSIVYETRRAARHERRKRLVYQQFTAVPWLGKSGGSLQEPCGFRRSWLGCGVVLA